MRRGYALLAVPLVAGALVIVWWAPWSSSPDPVARARVTFGDQPVVHVVARRSTRARPPYTEPETEIWYDPGRDQLHFVARHNGVIEAESVTPAGPATTPTRAFVLEYAADLAHHSLRSAGRGVVQSRPVIWLQARDFEVAVDPVSYQPLWVTGPGRAGPLTQLVTAETTPFDPADFLTAKQKKPRHL